MSSTAASDEPNFLRRALIWWDHLGSWDVELDTSAAREAEAQAVDSRNIALEDLKRTRMTFDTRELNEHTRKTMPTVGDLKARLKSEHAQMKEAFGANAPKK